MKYLMDHCSIYPLNMETVLHNCKPTKAQPSKQEQANKRPMVTLDLQTSTAHVGDSAEELLVVHSKSDVYGTLQEENNY